ncbi:methionyl-tRNA formyltransferase [uncultured Williamsia sp.]|uniref:methionyl-tRNA formyltransferase n=1 Tax=uncultured Williamsia sp. TaxID=259311 RepID=UPI00260F7487|nr:methionyl-tRNA formyltransferase [uncultured Williamsia sp.]
MRIVFAGTPEPAVPSLRQLIASPHHEVVGVLTRPDAVAGRGRTVTRSPVGLVADDEGIEVATPRRLRDPDAHETLTRWAPDCVAVVAYGALVPPDLLDLPRHGWINLHFSLLPAWRGAAPVQAAIAAGDEFTGASTFRIEEGLDTGPVFGTLTERIRPDDTSGALLARLADAGAHLLASTLDGIDRGELVAVPQPADGVSTAPKIEVADAQVTWNRPAHVVDRLIRSRTPDPGAWTLLGDTRVKLGPVTVATDGDVPDEIGPLAPGAVAATKKAVFVGTASAPVRLGQVQPPGKKPIAAADWARGARLDANTVFA